MGQQYLQTYIVHKLINESVKVIRCNLDELLKNRSLTAKDLHEDTRIPNADIRELLSGRARMIEFDVLEAMCDYLACTVGDLLEHSNP